MSAYIFDTETTGLKEPQVVEAAWIKLKSCSLHLPGVAQFLQRYKPSKPISLGALSTCHILDEDLADCPPHTDFALPADAAYLIGHNVDFDWRVAGEPDVKRICTRALSSMLWPDADSHTQSAMIYLHYRERAADLLQRAHSALADVKNCRLLLHACLQELDAGGQRVESWEQLWELSEIARIPTVIRFGKHAGSLIKDLPSDYRTWLLRQPDLDPYLLKALSS